MYTPEQLEIYRYLKEVKKFPNSTMITLRKLPRKVIDEISRDYGHKTNRNFNQPQVIKY